MQRIVDENLTSSTQQTVWACRLGSKGPGSSLNLIMSERAHSNHQYLQASVPSFLGLSTRSPKYASWALAPSSFQAC